METSNLFTSASELQINISEKEAGAFGHFIYPVFRNVAKFKGNGIIQPAQDSFYDQLYGKDGNVAEAYFTRCGEGAYMGLTRIVKDTQNITISFILSDRDYPVEEALEKHFEFYVKKGRDQFSDVEIQIPEDFFFSDKEPDSRLFYLVMSYCLQKKKYVRHPIDMKLFRSQLQRSRRGTETYRSGMDAIQHIVEYDLGEALLTARDIVQVWR